MGTRKVIVEEGRRSITRDLVSMVGVLCVFSWRHTRSVAEVRNNHSELLDSWSLRHVEMISAGKGDSMNRRGIVSDIFDGRGD